MARCKSISNVDEYLKFRGESALPRRANRHIYNGTELRRLGDRFGIHPEMLRLKLKQAGWTLQKSEHGRLYWRAPGGDPG